MKVTLEYQETQYLPVRSMSIIGKFNNYDAQKGKMMKQGDKWILECYLSPGEHYYKLVINGNIKLNDPMANLYLPDNNDELWSVIMVDKDENRLYSNTEYTVNIEEYAITSTIQEGLVQSNKKDFNLRMDERVVTRFKFTQVTGVHAITALWYTSAEELFATAENNLFVTEGEEDKPIHMWFWIDLQDPEKVYREGIWKMKLFVDGQFILEDQFNIRKMNSYSPLGKPQYR